MTAMRALLLLSVAALAACGDDPADLVAPTGTSILLEAKREEAPAWHEANVARRDAVDDDWRGEALFSLAKPAFDSFLGGLVAGTSVADLLAPGFETSALRPDDLELLFADGGTTVRRGAPGPERHGAEDLPRLAEALLATFSSARDHEHGVHSSFKVVGVEITREDVFETVALLHVVGPSPRGHVQQNAHLSASWRVVGKDERVLLESLAVESFEEVEVGRELFGELTDHVLGGIPLYRNDFLRGIADHRYRTDILMGNHLTGMQGFALGDVDGDGRDDLYVVQPGGLMNRLLLQREDGTVEDRSEASGLAFRNSGRSTLILDFDNDGDQDVALSLANRVLIAFNQGDGTFTSQATLKLPEDADVYSMCAADPDGDGDLDLYCCRWSYTRSRFNINDPPLPYHDAQNGPPNVFWRQDAPGEFTDATAEVGLDLNNTRFSYAAIWEDLDEDGDVDLYVANDFGRNNLFINRGGRFVDTAASAQAEDKSSGMGVTAGDFDLDGDRDLYVSNMFSSAGQRIVPQYALRGKEQEDLLAAHFQFAVGNTLLRNDGNATFTDVSRQAGVTVGGWAWGALFVDFNNDGYPDIYGPNGYITNEDPVDL